MTDRLTTQRLVLRRPDGRDTQAYIDFFTSERARYIERMSETAAWRAFAIEAGHWTIRHWGMFTVCLAGDEDTPIGLVGPWYPADWPEKEIGWILYPGHEGAGYAEEAARATLTHAFCMLGWDTAVSYIDPANSRSIALAEKLGARRDDAAPRKNPGDLVYRHDPALWLDADGGMEAYA